MAFPIKLNFRGTSGYVTDGSGQTYCLQESHVSGSAVNRSPIGDTPNQMFFGGSNSSLMLCGDANASNDPRLAGWSRMTSEAEYRVISGIPAGNYNLRLASGLQMYARVVDLELRDGASTVIATVTGTTPAANNFLDAAGNNHTAANWPGNNVSIEVSIVTGELRVYGTDLQDFVTYLGLEPVASPDPPVVSKMIGALRQVS